VVKENEKEPLWQRMETESVAGLVDVAVPRRGSRPARRARLQLRFAQVVLSPPSKSKLLPLSVWAVYAREVGYPTNVKEPIDWMF
jgi:hypothetical protein